MPGLLAVRLTILGPIRQQLHAVSMYSRANSTHTRFDEIASWQLVETAGYLGIPLTIEKLEDTVWPGFTLTEGPLSDRSTGNNYAHLTTKKHCQAAPGVAMIKKAHLTKMGR